MNDPAEILEAAAAYIDAHGWTQHEMYGRRVGNEPPSACLVGAIREAAVQLVGPIKPIEPFWGEGALTRPSWKAYLQAIDAICAHLGLHAETIADWNDQPVRTEASVTEALRRSAKELRETRT